MGMLMIRCPRTGRAIPTGRNVEPAIFRRAAVFFSRTYCPLCHATHEWFVNDAWVAATDNQSPSVAQQSPAATSSLPKSVT